MFRGGVGVEQGGERGERDGRMSKKAKGGGRGGRDGGLAWVRGDWI